MSTEERPASEWSDSAERDRWADALAAIATRERLERGVDEPTRLTVEYGALWAYYGRIRIRLAGAHADLQDEESLFEEIDSWVAFERPAGPGRRLERDQAVIDEWLGRLPSVRALWSDAADRVFRDVVATTRIRWSWRIAVHEDESMFPDVPDGVVGFGQVRFLQDGRRIDASWPFRSCGWRQMTGQGHCRNHRGLLMRSLMSQTSSRRRSWRSFAPRGPPAPATGTLWRSTRATT